MTHHHTASIPNQPLAPATPHRRTRSERGAIAVWTSITLFAFILVIGLGVDLSGHTMAEQRIRTIAQEAARAGAQEVAVPIDATALDAGRAAHAARRYLDAAGASGTAQATGPTTVAVTVRGRYHCAFLPIIGVWEIPVEASATADLTPSYQGRSS